MGEGVSADIVFFYIVIVPMVLFTSLNRILNHNHIIIQPYRLNIHLVSFVLFPNLAN